MYHYICVYHPLFQCSILYQNEENTKLDLYESFSDTSLLLLYKDVFVQIVFLQQ